MPFMDAELNKEVGCIGLSVVKSIAQPHCRISLQDKTEARNCVFPNAFPTVPGEWFPM